MGRAPRESPGPTFCEDDIMIYRNGIPTPSIGLRRELDRLMDETLGRMGSAVETGSWGPAMDIVEDADGLVVELELPGVAWEDVEITTDKGVLTIRGEKRTVRQREGVRAITTERAHGRFARALQLPQGVDEAKIEAELDNGLLRVRIPRAALPQPRKVEIRGASTRAAVDARTDDHATAEGRLDSNREVTASGSERR